MRTYQALPRNLGRREMEVCIVGIADSVHWVSCCLSTRGYVLFRDIYRYYLEACVV